MMSPNPHLPCLVVTALLGATALFLNWRCGLLGHRISMAKMELAIALQGRDRAIRESAKTVAALHRQVDHLERMRRTGLWVAEQQESLRELREALGKEGRDGEMMTSEPKGGRR